LYGTASYGGASDLGAVFKVNTNGTGFCLLHSFSTNSSGGATPRGGLTRGQDGAWYGTTSVGGSWGKGTVFRLGTPPSIVSQPGSRTNFPNTFAAFAVTAVGPQPLSFQWQRNGINLLEGGNVSGSTTPALTLGHVCRGDEAGYSVVVTNWAGSVTSLPATLTVGALPELFGISSAPDGTFQLMLSARPGYSYRIDASTNLIDWQAVTNLPNPGGVIQFIDAGASNFQQRFYRAAWAP
jgi:uncharacterized repeat protein (TIGR03803 family)